MDYKRLPIGVEDFDEIINDDLYYVDKTLFIKELINKRGKVNLFMRPRRFGKSLTISMLQHFFEVGRDGASLFKGLKIAEVGQRYMSEMNKYPVIQLTLKSVNGLSYEDSYEDIKSVLAKEFKRHRYLLDSEEICEGDKTLYKEILSGKVSHGEYSRSLQFLTECLEQHHGEKVVVLIDEYDVPLEKSYFNGYYKEMLKFIRSLFDNVLKTNSSLHFAVLTGCLRVSKESIFTGLNNPEEISIISNHYDEFFGFTEQEVAAMLSYYQLEAKAKVVRSWYNGYVFGQTRVYNPWSIIRCIKDFSESSDWLPVAYWSNTSSNDIVRHLIEVSDDDAKEELECLIRGDSITVPIHEEIVYGDIIQEKENLWNFLFFTGYLTKVRGFSDKDGERYFSLAIPNKEVRIIYKRQIEKWFKEKVKIADTAPFLKAIMDGDTETIIKIINQRLKATISFHDSAENFYHGFMTGILSGIEGYIIKSNCEYGLKNKPGDGRSDIFMKTTKLPKKAVIFELKVLKDNEDAGEKCEEALRQIEEKHYAYELEQERYLVIQKYGIAFYRKSCMAKCQPANPTDSSKGSTP